MRETVAVNGLTLCHKNASGLVQATVPDVCKTPAGNSTPPLPYPNIAYARDLAKGTRTVKSNGGAMCGIKGSEFSRSTGDEPGTAKGVKSGTVKGRATFILWSPNVFAEGKNVTRLTDHMLMNDGNTVSMGGYYTGTVTGGNPATLDLLCQIACECLGNGNQSCAASTLNAMPRTPTDGLYPEITFGRDGVPYRNPDGSPQTRMGVPGSRLDVTRFTAGQPVEFYEMKFPGDRFRGDQERRYQRLAGGRLQVVKIPKDCNNCDGEREPVEEPETQSEGPSGWEIAGIGLLAVGAAGLTWWAGGTGGAGVLAAFGLAGTASAM